ncbi:DNA mismatch repair protein [Aspergillus piperis CBS 112811]|uniref:DNA mismatch repair protein n=1 Tax=Aspergillus piperis CBS 112811 TaxID=1448313 RepID=A0A8G1RCE0_9EURO|nr:DNA mismatch repair protein [Aspergillus piperis CBS 112811]RAH61860.1 DNA mismatch repair protein [Aspergillus piperis CBS 112811]
MSSWDPKIRPLPPDVVAKLKSSTAITHLNGVIVELVKNALDANARTVYVTVDFCRGGCIVEDDGDGIPPAEFETDGGLGKAHHTSKYHSSHAIEGRKGLFLASLSALSLLTITSHHVRHSSTNTVTFHHSTPVARLMPAPAYQALRFSAHGTSVTVNDLFGNMPVRVKSRALALQRPDELERQWEELRHFLVSYMVANDRMAKLVVLDAHREKKITVYPQRPARQYGGEPDLQRLRSILAQSGLVEAQNAGIWDTVSASVSDFTIHAAVSLTPSPTKKVQFVSLGSNPVFARNNANLIYAEVNRSFALSDFGSTSRSSAVEASARTPDGQLMHSKPASKAVNKWPMFYIRIDSCNEWNIGDDTQELPESDKSLQRILDVLSTMINEFLRQSSLRPRTGKRKRGAPNVPPATTRPSSVKTGRSLASEGVGSVTEETLGGQLKLPSLRRPPNVSHHFGDWTRIKSAKPETFSKMLPLRSREFGSARSEKNPAHQVRDQLNQQSALLSAGEEGTATEPQSPIPDVSGMHEGQLNQVREETDTDRIVPWVDPYTGRRHLINSRTGQSMLLRSSGASDVMLRPQSTGCIQEPHRTSDEVQRPRSVPLQRTDNKWVEKLLDNWINPVFGRPERPISAVDVSASHETARPGPSSRDNHGELCGLESMGVSKFRGKLRKQDLRAAEVIAQVDQKFILIKMQMPSNSPGGPASNLILIDQHAADERCRVEALMAELFTSGADSSASIHTITLEPIIFEIPTTEASLFRRYKEFFQSWGVTYTIEQGPKDKNVFIFVRTLPTLIAERCRTEPDLVTDLIRGEIWRREEENGRSRQPRNPSGFAHPRPDMAQTNSSNSSSWVDRLDGCPRGIIDLLNSRACRTAIMFNDVLDKDECQSLVRRLADCVFPFQCAHGRPSMIPILEMGPATVSLDQTPEDNEYEGPGFVGMFRKWRDRESG